LHFAGGNCYSFNFLRPYLSAFDVRCPELPGRGRRANEPLLKDFEMAANDIYEQICSTLDNAPFLLYGHSMGAFLALRMANMLEEGGKSPSALIVSGNAGPGKTDNKRRYLLERKEFVAELERLGGVPSELLANEDLFNFFEPVLRADFEVSERNKMTDERAVNTLLYAIMGKAEEGVEDISNWGKFTRSKFRSEMLDGGHFFIHDHPQRIAAIINDSFHSSMQRPFYA
jgi:external thioesterase TEII